MSLKITINGKAYGSMDEVPEEMRGLIQEGMKRGLAGPGARTTFRGTFRIGSAGEEAPGALLPPLEAPANYRLKVKAMESGQIPGLFPLETLFIPLLTVLLVAAGASLFFSLQAGGGHPGIPGIVSAFVVMAVSTVGIIRLLDRQRRRDLHPMLENCAGRIPGAFVTVQRGSPVLSFARDAWNGFASFYSGSKNSPAYSRIDARFAPSSARLLLRPRNILDRVLAHDDTVETGDQDFDRRFLLTSPDPSFALSLFDASRREAVSRLAGHGGGLSVLVTGSFMRVSIGRNLARPGHGSRVASNEEKLAGFLADAVLLVDPASHLVVALDPPPSPTLSPGMAGEAGAE